MKIYMYYDNSKNSLVISGVSHIRILHHLLNKLSNILVINGVTLNESFSGFDKNTFCEYSLQNDINYLTTDLNTPFSNIALIDFDSLESLDKLSKLDVAKILYLGKFSEPIDSPFFNALNNNFAFLSLDDGTYNKLFCQNSDCIKSLINSLIDLNESIWCDIQRGCLIETYENDKVLVVQNNLGNICLSDDIDKLLSK